MKPRSIATVVVGAAGVFFGFVGAAFLNLAGLKLGQRGFEPGLAWENGESEYSVFLGCGLLLLGLVSLGGVVLLSHAGQQDHGLRVLGRWVTVIGFIVLTGLFLASVAVLPRL
jgi:drug/metabolite transporter (DMT)-like permease